MEPFTIFLGIFVALLIYFYLKIKETYKYFEKRNIPYVEPYFLFGSAPSSVLFRKHISEGFGEMYWKLKGHKVGGFFRAFVPTFIVLDPEYVNKVFISDFSHFHDRGFKVDEKTNPLEGHLFLLNGQKWRYLRNKLSPIFTSGKLRWMFEEMSKCGDALVEHFTPLANGNDLNCKEDLAGFTTDVIGSCAFGLNPESQNNRNSRFRVMGRKVFEISVMQRFLFIFRRLLPGLFLKLKIKTVPKDVDEFFTDLLTQTMDYRKKAKVERKDIVQLLMQLKEKGSVDIQSHEKEEIQNGIHEENDSFKIEFNDGLLAAQSFIFFVAGFETTSSTMYFSLYFMSKYPEIQEKARQEVRRVKAKFGEINYDALKEMEYVEKCILETLRIFPPVAHLFRECTKDYTFPDGTKIEKGILMIIPIYTLQRDPEFFPDPLVYRPERFDNPPIPGTYAPFGDGPRICIGKRFALMESKMALARLLDNFKFEESNKTVEPIEMSLGSFILNPKHGLYIRAKKIEAGH